MFYTVLAVELSLALHALWLLIVCPNLLRCLAKSKAIMLTGGRSLSVKEMVKFVDLMDKVLIA